jgi:hypothetical protein
MKRLIWVATLLLTGSICVAAQNVQDRHMLQGLSGLTVFLRPPPTQVRTAFVVSAADITTQVELRLRQGGVRIIDSANAKETPLLVITTAATVPNTDDPALRYLYAVNIDVELLQRARLSTTGKTPERMGYVGTWHSSKVYLYGLESAQSHFKDDILRIVDEFLNDYLAENPKL